MSCADCLSGAEHEGTPRGKVTIVHSFNSYVTEPPNGAPVKGIIVIIPDAFGWEFNNNRLLADHYAEKGAYRVYLPDFMQGHSAPTWLIPKFRIVNEPGYAGILSKLYTIPQVIYGAFPFIYHNRPAKAYPHVRSFFTMLRAATGSTLPIGIAGFCWGGKLLLMLGGESGGQTLFEAGFTGHPSMLDVPGDLERLQKPVSFAIAENDKQTPMKAVEVIRKVVEGKEGKNKGEVVVYEGCGHGFCVRADIATESSVARQAEEAEDQCVRWFDGQFGLVE